MKDPQPSCYYFILPRCVCQAAAFLFFTELSPALRELWKTSRKFPRRFFMFPRVPHLAPPPRGRGRLSPRRAVGAGGGLSALRAVLDTGPFAS